MSAGKIIEWYDMIWYDIDIKYCKDEVLHLIEYAKEENESNLVDMYKLLIEGQQSTFPNIETILRSAKSMMWPF